MNGGRQIAGSQDRDRVAAAASRTLLCGTVFFFSYFQPLISRLFCVYPPVKAFSRKYSRAASKSCHKRFWEDDTADDDAGLRELLVNPWKLVRGWLTLSRRNRPWQKLLEPLETSRKDAVGKVWKLVVGIWVSKNFKAGYGSWNRCLSSCNGGRATTLGSSFANHGAKLTKGPQMQLLVRNQYWILKAACW